jgi:uncharacterized protein YdeI (YjbR/CyaY-like superfamily)
MFYVFYQRIVSPGIAYIWNNYQHMLKKGEHIEGTPAELEEVLKQDAGAKEFFEGLSKGYKQGYCDWVGSAKQAETRQVRAEKALKMLQNRQKTLKT